MGLCCGSWYWPCHRTSFPGDQELISREAGVKAKKGTFQARPERDRSESLPGVHLPESFQWVTSPSQTSGFCSMKWQTHPEVFPAVHPWNTDHLGRLFRKGARSHGHTHWKTLQIPLSDLEHRLGPNKFSEILWEKSCLIQNSSVVAANLGVHSPSVFRIKELTSGNQA